MIPKGVPPNNTQEVPPFKVDQQMSDGKWDTGNSIFHEPQVEKYEITAYSVGDEFTPNHGITASGRKVKDGETAACPPEIPFGTRIAIEGVGERVCYDRGGRITSGHIDVYMADINEALTFGRQLLEVRFLGQ